jgi:hypothetical protein
VTRQSTQINPRPPSHKHHFHDAMLVTICVVGARMARLWWSMLVPKRERRSRGVFWCPSFIWLTP